MREVRDVFGQIDLGDGEYDTIPEGSGKVFRLLACTLHNHVIDSCALPHPACIPFLGQSDSQSDGPLWCGTLIADAALPAIAEDAQ